MKRKNRVTAKPHIYLDKSDLEKSIDIIEEIQKEAKRTVLAGDIHGSIYRHGLNNPDKIKGDFI